MSNHLLISKFEASAIPEPNCGCLIWLGAHTRKTGRGFFFFEGKLQLAGRVIWQMHHGPIAPGLWVLHKCDMPACVEINHLFLGTPTDNVQDMLKKDRHAKRRPNGSKVPETLIAVIRADTRRQAVIAADYGINQSQVSRIKTGRRRKAWSDEERRALKPAKRRKLSRSDGEAIIADTRPLREIAATYGVGANHVGHIKLGYAFAWQRKQKGN